MSVSFADIQQAAEDLHGIAHVTPVLTSRQLNGTARCTVFLKCENFQRVGAFKFRGAYHAISILPPSDRGRPIVTISSGNHAQGVALACRLLGREAHILSGGLTSRLKRHAILAYQARIHEAADHLDAEHKLPDLLAKINGVYIHPFDHPPVIAGQGTILQEFLTTTPDLDVLLAPVGGGGLLSGLCIAGHHLKPNLRLFACEPVGALDAMHSVRENRIVPMTAPQTIAEGLKTSLGEFTLPILRRHLSGFFPVEEKEILQAVRFAFERLKIVIEPSAAVALAPLLRPQPELVGQRVGVVITGGNVDSAALLELLRRSDAQGQGGG